MHWFCGDTIIQPVARKAWLKRSLPSGVGMSQDTM